MLRKLPFSFDSSWMLYIFPDNHIVALLQSETWAVESEVLTLSDFCFLSVLAKQDKVGLFV